MSMVNCISLCYLFRLNQHSLTILNWFDSVIWSILLTYRVVALVRHRVSTWHWSIAVFGNFFWQYCGICHFSCGSALFRTHYVPPPYTPDHLQLTAHSRLQIIFVIRRSFVWPGASFNWTRSQSGQTKNTKQYEEIKFQREWTFDTFGHI